MTSATHLFPPPMEDAQYPQKTDQRGNRPDPADRTDWLTPYGYCHSFCAMEGPAHGWDEHRPMCNSVAFGGDVEAWQTDAARVDIYTDLVGTYSHGIYTAATCTTVVRSGNTSCSACRPTAAASIMRGTACT